MQKELSNYLEIASDGCLYSILEWDDEYHRDKVIGVDRIQELLFFVVQVNNYDC